MKDELNPDQANAWKKEIDARNAFRDQAIAGLIVSGFDQMTTLLPDQSLKLEVMVEKVLADYAYDFGRSFSNNGSAWFLESFTMLMPIFGIPGEGLEGTVIEGAMGCVDQEP